jgi:hypothetical protein
VWFKHQSWARRVEAVVAVLEVAWIDEAVACQGKEWSTGTQAPGLVDRVLSAILDVAAETVTFAMAGHPRPLLRLPDRRVRLHDTANGQMIGLGTAPGGAQIAPFPTRPERRRCRVSGDARWRRNGESGIVEARRSSPAPGC